MDTEREVTRCQPCNLVQFVNKTRTCVKCKQSFDNPKVVAAVPVLESPIPLPMPNRGLNFWLPLMLAYLRAKRGFSERQLANYMLVPRSYISKVENGRAVPNIATFRRYSAALGCEPAYVLRITAFMVDGR